MSEIESSVIHTLTENLKTVCPNVFFGKSQIIYPKINADLRLMSETSYRSRYRLVLDYYTNDGKPQSAVAMSEAVRTVFYAGQAYDGRDALIAAEKNGNGGFGEEKDNEKIIHYIDSYQVDFYKSTED